MKAVKKVVILGTGGNSVDILEAINELNSHEAKTLYECSGFLDDNQSLWGNTVQGLKVLGPLSHAAQLSGFYFVNGIGAPSNFWKKELIVSSTGVSQDRFETIIHPSSSISQSAHIDQGTVIFQNVTITSNVRIGRHVIVLPHTVISHDVIIGDYTCITGGVCVSGGVSIGRSCYLGSNCTINGNVHIGDHSLIGMGGVVLEHIPGNSIFVGNPARFLRHTI